LTRGLVVRHRVVVVRVGRVAGRHHVRVGHRVNRVIHRHVVADRLGRAVVGDLVFGDAAGQGGGGGADAGGRAAGAAPAGTAGAAFHVQGAAEDRAEGVVRPDADGAAALVAAAAAVGDQAEVPSGPGAGRQRAQGRQTKQGGGKETL